ncbi:MAG: ABC transporter permease subunit [Verrucomicrobiota bacterium]
MSTVFALAGVVVKELYRRKDFYVLFFLVAVMTLVMGSVSFFNDPKLVRDLKDICLLMIWISTLTIAVMTAARQIPAERESRTIFPLLAKPVTRAQFLMGKFTGCFLAVGLALVLFYVSLMVLSGWREGSWPVLNWFQAFWLHWVMLGVVIAMVLMGSLLFTAPSSNGTICFIIVLAILLLGEHLNQVAVAKPEPARSIIYTIYYVIPHLEWFDIRKFLIYGWPLVPWGYCALATLYAFAYVGLFLFGSWLLFRKQALTA